MTGSVYGGISLIDVLNGISGGVGNKAGSTVGSTVGGDQGGGGLLDLLSNFFSSGEGGSQLLDYGQLGLETVGTIGGLMNSRNMLGLARDQFKHARDVTNTNLTNQIQSYNTALSDRARSRAVMEGRDMESANRYIEENKLRR